MKKWKKITFKRQYLIISNKNKIIKVKLMKNITRILFLGESNDAINFIVLLS